LAHRSLVAPLLPLLSFFHARPPASGPSPAQTQGQHGEKGEGRGGMLFYYLILLISVVVIGDFTSILPQLACARRGEGSEGRCRPPAGTGRQRNSGPGLLPVRRVGG